MTDPCTTLFLGCWSSLTSPLLCKEQSGNAKITFRKNATSSMTASMNKPHEVFKEDNMAPAPLSIGVAIASYQRPDDLKRCLQALSEQSQLPSDVMVVVRSDDEATKDVVATATIKRLLVRQIFVDAPGLVAARNVALASCRTDILTFIDDDTVPHRDWLERIVPHFADDPTLGGLGGKDRIHNGTSFDDRTTCDVGRIQWFGRVVPNHHLGHGAPWTVDFIKGANMSFRANAFQGISFDERLRGIGAQPYEDLVFCSAIRHAGWKLLYDPNVVVEHFLGKREEIRHYADIATVKDKKGFQDFAFNEVVAIWGELPASRLIAFALWSFVVGTGVCPGLLQAIRFTPKLGISSWQRFALAQKGKFDAFIELGLRHRPR